MLIILGGLPGVGKTTLARALSQHLNATHIRVDTIEQAIRASGMLTADVGPAGYMVAYGVAEDNLRVGKMVVADSVNPLKVTRDAWRAVAERTSAEIVEVQIVRSDRDDHQRIVTTRTSDIEGLIPPTWDDVVTREYEAWDRSPHLIDTSFKTVDESLSELLEALKPESRRDWSA
ncbi:MAG: AAA family ATPase [Microvirga sp.]